jgi:hypothetical protein
VDWDCGQANAAGVRRRQSPAQVGLFAVAVGFLQTGRGVDAMGNDSPSFLGLLGIGDDNPVPARVDLEDNLNLKAAVDRLEIGGVLLFTQLILFGVFTNLALTAQVGIAGIVVILIDVVDRKLVGHFLD